MTEPQEPRGTASDHLTTDELSECAFSPETAAAGWLEHAEGCAECAAELADLRLLLAELAELPEPELPESVGIRLDAAVARAWLEADAEAERKAEDDARGARAVGARRGGRRSWRRLAVPLGSLALILAVVAGVGALVHSASTGSSSSASSGTNGVAAGSPAFGGVDSAPASPGLTAWVHSVLPTAAANSRAVTPNAASGSSGGSGAKQPEASAMAKPDALACSAVPPLAGYTVLTISRREFDGVAATLVVYQSTKEPAPNTVYAVVYAGSACPSSTSPVLARGTVTR